jgi:hypothetical protein
VTQQILRKNKLEGARNLATTKVARSSLPAVAARRNRLATGWTQ